MHGIEYSGYKRHVYSAQPLREGHCKVLDNVPLTSILKLPILFKAGKCNITKRNTINILLVANVIYKVPISEKINNLLRK